MSKNKGIKASQKSDRRKAHGSKRLGNSTFADPKPKYRYSKVTVSYRAPEPKTDLRIHNPRGGAVHIPEIPEDEQPKHIARLVPVEDHEECRSYTRYGNKRIPCNCKRHLDSHDKRRRGMFSGSTMIAGR